MNKEQLYYFKINGLTKNGSTMVNLITCNNFSLEKAKEFQKMFEEKVRNKERYDIWNHLDHEPFSTFIETGDFAVLHFEICRQYGR